MVISNKILSYVSAAEEEARKSNMMFALGAVVVRNGKIVGRGHNTTRTYKNGSCCPSVHAEVNAISEFCSRVRVPQQSCKKGKEQEEPMC